MCELCASWFVAVAVHVRPREHDIVCSKSCANFGVFRIRRRALIYANDPSPCKSAAPQTEAATAATATRVNEKRERASEQREKF